MIMELAKLDFESEDFDPKHALSVNISAIRLPVPDAKLYNHLDEYERKSFGKKSESSSSSSFKKAKVKRAVMPDKSVEEVKKTLKPARLRKEPPTVITIMQNMVGPMAFLRKCMRKKIRVMLRRRKISYQACDRISNLYGCLVMFDKHGNLIMKDVQERIKIHDNQQSSNELIRRYNLLFVRGSNIILVNLLAHQ